MDKAYCKEFVVDLNQHQIFYPEMPAYIPEIRKIKKLPLVFATWIRDTFQRCENAFNSDTRIVKENGNEFQYFEPQRFMKDKDDIEKCEE